MRVGNTDAPRSESNLVLVATQQVSANGVDAGAFKAGRDLAVVVPCNTENEMNSIFLVCLSV